MREDGRANYIVTPVKPRLLVGSVHSLRPRRRHPAVSHFWRFDPGAAHLKRAEGEESIEGTTRIEEVSGRGKQGVKWSIENNENIRGRTERNIRP
jgi:hypothetical protein